MRSTQTKERQDGHDDDHQADTINDSVHLRRLRLDYAFLQTERLWIWLPPALRKSCFGRPDR
jgi:hypothetical protein